MDTDKVQNKDWPPQASLLLHLYKHTISLTPILTPSNH